MNVIMKVEIRLNERGVGVAQDKINAQLGKQFRDLRTGTVMILYTQKNVMFCNMFAFRVYGTYM